MQNRNVPGEPNLSEPDVADAEWFLDEMLTIYPVLGVDANGREECKNKDSGVAEGASGGRIDVTGGRCGYR
jgi:hypothetical protein